MLKGLIAACLLLVLPMTQCFAGLVVVANPKCGVSKLTRDDVINIFLGRFRQLPSGVSAQPIDLPTSQPEKGIFYRALVNKDLAEINAYWARLVFAGRTTPPLQSKSPDELLDFVAGTPGGIGYLERAKVDPRVKVVFELEQ